MDYDSSFNDRPKIRPLNANNYRQWAVQVSVLLKAQGLWTIVEGMKKKTSEDLDTMKRLGPDLAMRDAKASSIIMGLCGQGALVHILLIDGAQAQWTKLKSIYAPLGLDQLDAKMHEFTNYQGRAGATIAQIATELDTMQAEIGFVSSEEMPTNRMKRSVLFRCVRQINPLYDSVILQLSLADQNEYDTVVTLLTEYERRIAADAKPAKENVFSAQAQRQNGAGSTTKRFHKGQGKLKQGQKAFTGRCYKCNEEGHRKQDCPLLERNKGSTGPLATPYGGRGLSPPAHGSFMTQETAWSATEANEGSCRPNAITWVIDSGCSRHMTYSKEAFVDYNRLTTPITIRIANGSSIEAIAEGTARLRVFVRGRIEYVLLRDVLHVPNVAGSLISVPQLQDRGIMSSTTRDGNWVLKKDGKIVGIAKRFGRLYALDSGLVGHEQPTNIAYRAEVSEDKIWHRRFGHLSSSSLQNVHKVTKGLESPLRPLSDVCEPCIASKMTRNVSRVEPERAKHVLGRIFTDGWGPYRVPALNGCHDRKSDRG